MNWTKSEWTLISTVAILLFIAVNLVSFFVIKSQFGISIYDTQTYKNKKNSIKIDLNKSSIPHPFFGISFEGGIPFQNQLTPEPLFDRISIIKENNSINILVLGGSVASNMSNGGSHYQEHLLATLLNSHFKTERFVVFNAAFGGGKQPQQYFKYQYLDLLGFRPDIVINLDGFNEIALTLSENLPQGIPAIFPRLYSGLLHASTSNRSCIKINNKILDINTLLPFTELLIWIYVKECLNTIEGAKTKVPWWSSALGYESTNNYLSNAITIWEQSSNKLNEVLIARGIDYIHALQPNQYLEGSKKFSDIEKEQYLNFETYGKPIRDNYSKLSKKNLTTHNFRDQRYLFKNVTETVYVDSCCHFNELGMQLIIKDLIISNEGVFKNHLIKN